METQVEEKKKKKVWRPPKPKEDKRGKWKRKPTAYTNVRADEETKLRCKENREKLKLQEELESINKMGEDDKKKALSLILDKIEARKKKYWIVDTKLNRIPQQQSLFEVMVNRLKINEADRIRFYLYYGWNGAWKCWSPDEEVIGADFQMKRVWDLKVGDKLMGPDSLPRTIVETHTGRSNMYRIYPESGEPIVVNGSHQLELIHRRRNKKWVRSLLQEEFSHLKDIVPEWKLVQISVEDYIKKSTKWKAEAYMWRPSIINFDEKQLSVDPYFLWVWLWDWNTYSPWITSIDNEIIDYVRGYAEELGLEIRQSWITYYLKKEVRSRYWFSGYSHLREIDVLWNKHIPINYLTSSEAQRLELLAWLVDTDGEVAYGASRTPRYSITQKSEKLARDIMMLARSLWFRSNITKSIKVCTNATRKDYIPWEYFKVSINGDVWRIPCKIERKKYKEKERRHNKDWLVTKFSVESIWDGEYFGFQLDGDSLHLDKNLIVHHNSFIGCYLTVLQALGMSWKKYGLPYLGTKKNIWILTKSGSNVKSVIYPYLLWEGSATRIPPDEVEKVNLDNGILKGIILKNGCEIHIKTYDQGSENLQGGNPDWIWMDEEPVSDDVFTEIIARTRRIDCEMVITMTPLSWLTRVYEYFLNQQNEEVRKRSVVYKVSSLDNPYTDKTWALWLTDEEYRLRVDGSFENPTGLVYSCFNRRKNTITHIKPEELGNFKAYRSIDFGVSHPTGVVFAAQDEDNNVYVWDEIYGSNILIADLSEKIYKKSRGYEFLYTLGDSAAKRERYELAQYGIKAEPADKHSKGENEMSNRRSGIMMVNQMLKDGKLIISETCTNLIKEFETHYYKEWGKKDGEVNKTDDDLLDALRYLIFNLKKEMKMEDMAKINYQRRFWETIGWKKLVSFSNL